MELMSSIYFLKEHSSGRAASQNSFKLLIKSVPNVYTHSPPRWFTFKEPPSPIETPHTPPAINHRILIAEGLHIKEAKHTITQPSRKHNYHKNHSELHYRLGYPAIRMTGWTMPIIKIFLALQRSNNQSGST